MSDEKMNVGGAKVGGCKGCYFEGQLDADGYCDSCDPPNDVVHEIGSRIVQGIQDFLAGRKARKEKKE